MRKLLLLILLSPFALSLYSQTRAAQANPITATSTPIATDTFGNYHFYATAGVYTIQIYGPGIQTPFVLADQSIGLSSTFGGSIANAQVPFGTGSNILGGDSLFTYSGATHTLTASYNCKKIQNVRCIDTANSPGWSGSELGAWINAASADIGGPGTILVGPGSYGLTTPIVPLSAQAIICNGSEGSCVISGTGLAPNNHFFSFSSLSDVRISGFTMTGPGAAGAGGSQDSRGVSCSGCTRLEVDHNFISSVSFAIAASPDTDGNIHDNRIANVGQSGISAGGTLSTQIRNNRINNVGSTNQHHGIYLQNGSGVLVQGNQISSIQGFCIVAQENIIAVSIIDFRILDNYCVNGGQAGSGSRGGIDVAALSPGTNQVNGVVVAHNVIETPGTGNGIIIAAAGNISVDDNIIRFHQNDGILISGSGAFNTEAITVTHNKLYSQSVAGNGIRALVGGALTRNVVISDNIVDSAFGSCIWVSGVTDTEIHDNRCKDWNIGGNVGNAGILLDSTALRVNVHDNTLSSANCTGSPPSIQIISGTRNQLHGNQFVNACGGITDAGTTTAKYDNIFSAGASTGKATLGAGTATVSTAEIQAGDVVQLTNCGVPEPGTITAGTSFNYGIKADLIRAPANPRKLIHPTPHWVGTLPDSGALSH